MLFSQNRKPAHLAVLIYCGSLCVGSCTTSYILIHLQNKWDSCELCSFNEKKNKPSLMQQSLTKKPNNYKYNTTFAQIITVVMIIPSSGNFIWEHIVLLSYYRRYQRQKCHQCKAYNLIGRTDVRRSDWLNFTMP